MTETAMERLQDGLKKGRGLVTSMGPGAWWKVHVELEDLEAVLAVVEAAQDVKRCSRFYQAKPGLGLELAAAADRLDQALDRLHSQASDEGKASDG